VLKHNLKMKLPLFLSFCSTIYGYTFRTQKICPGQYVQVYVHTSNLEDYHETSEQIDIRFIGKKGSTDWTKLNSRGSTLAVDTTKKFSISSLSSVRFNSQVGQLTEIRMRVRSGNIYDGWAASSIDVIVPYATDTACHKVQGLFNWPTGVFLRNDYTSEVSMKIADSYILTY